MDDPVGLHHRYSALTVVRLKLQSPPRLEPAGVFERDARGSTFAKLLLSMPPKTTQVWLFFWYRAPPEFAECKSFLF